MVKQTICFFVMLQSALECAQEVASAWLSPLELTACLHLASFDIHLGLHSFHCEPDHCWCWASTGSLLHEMATIAMALISLLLALLDWHVPPITCRILTAMCMHALRPESAWIAMALLLPTFGNRLPDQSSARRKLSATTTSPTTEQTGDNSMIPDTESNVQSMDDGTEPQSPELDPNDATTALCPAIESLDDVIANFGPRQGEGDAFQTLYADARSLKIAKQKQIREMCKPYKVAVNAMKEGKWSKRLDATLKRDIQEKLLERARVLSSRPANTAHSAAQERAATEFILEDAVADTLRRIKAITHNCEIIARVVDHGCLSQTCASHRVVTMCQEANWKTSADLDSVQPLDACGYIAADVVWRLREQALAEADSWHQLRLPDYSQQHCIEQGNNVLHKSGDDRILEADEVNRLIRHYSHLDQRHQAAEEWWGGAIAIDHFLTGLPNSIQELSTIASDKRHQWRAWIVNTQTSTQQGSHWFTVIISTQTRLPESTAAHGTSDASSSQPAMDAIASSSDEGTATVERSSSNSAGVDSVVMYVGPDQIRRHLRIRQDETGVVMDVRDDQRLVLFYGADDAAWVSSANLEDEEIAIKRLEEQRLRFIAHPVVTPKTLIVPTIQSPAPDRSTFSVITRESSHTERAYSSDTFTSFHNLFEAPDIAMTEMINWAYANATHRPVAEWLQACTQWDLAVATNDHHHQQKRRKLCKDHDIPFTRTTKTFKDPHATMVQIRQELIERIQQIRATMKSFGALGMLQSDLSSTQQQAGKASKSQSKAEQTLVSQYFIRASGPVASADSAAASILAIATDVGSTFLRLRAKQHDNQEDPNFDIVLKALGKLRNPINYKDLHEISTDKRDQPKTIRVLFKDRFFGTIAFTSDGSQQAGDHRSAFEHTHDWRSYYIKLLVLRQARRWLSATERLDAIEESPPTPKTIVQLAAAIRQHSTSEYIPFGSDFEDIDAYSPTISRLLAYAEIHDGCAHSHGTFGTPRQTLPYTYRELQELILQRRRRQAVDATARAPQQLVTSAEDLASRLRAFASDAIVVKHIIEFALPSKKRANAMEITPKAASAAAANRIKNRGAATEHAVCMDEVQDAEDDAPQPQGESTTADDDSAPAATDITAHSIGAATEVARGQKRLLKKHDDSHQTQHDVTLSESAAKAMADVFFKFIQQAGLQRRLTDMSAGQIVVLCIFHSRLSWQKGKQIQLHKRDQYWIPKPVYTPASQVQSPSPPHFVQQIHAEDTKRSEALMQPPRTCCLCGKGFIDMAALWKHCEDEHHSWGEAVKRMLWEAEQLEAIPVLPPDKRRIIQNFTAALTYSRPAEGHFGRDKVCMRQLVGCATCARVEWIDQCFPCHLFKDCPVSLRPCEKESDDEAEIATDESADEVTPTPEQRRGKLLKDDDGYYVLDARAIHELLDVNKYIEAWPLIPREELHASSVQHPSHPEYRWLLNTRRVPMQKPAEATAATAATTEPQLPRCAGIGVSGEPVWLCKSCTTALCRPEPLMPYFALANWNWGGRVHPLFYNLSIAMQALLGLAIMVCRLIVLRYSEHEEDQEKGFVGNTILLTQPRPEEIMQKLPPSNEDFSKYLSVCFNNQTMTAADVGKHRALEVERERYISCSEYRKKVCPVFSGVEIEVEQVRTQWPERAVPTAITQSAIGMDTLHTFNPTLDGPAAMRASTCTLPSNDNDGQVVNDDHGVDATEHGLKDDDAAATEHAPDAKADRVDAEGLPLDLPAEFCIGIQDGDAHDPIDLMIVFQKNLELVQESGKRIHHAYQRRVDAASTGSEEAFAAAAALAAEKATHGSALVELRRLAHKMGGKYLKKMEDALASARMEGTEANTSRTLHIKSGKPVNMFQAPAWAAAFVQFFYGDCAPNLDRPRRIGMRELFNYLANREELEYSLESDADDILIPESGYRAPPQSRWNTPEFMAIFADTVRKVAILQTTQHLWKGNAPKWRTDMQAICDAKVEHFEKLTAILARHGQQSMQEMMRAAAEHKLLPLFKALQYITFQTANIPLTQGYKVGIRQLGFALNIYDGPLTIFLTTNFADIYSPITVTLMNGAGEPLCKREVNLLQSVPCMPTLQAMHRALAKHPMLQVRLFLLMDELVHSELLCMKAFIGQKKYGHRDAEPTREDDFASNGQIGIAEIPRSALKPLEAQGRGFTHGHEKVILYSVRGRRRLRQLVDVPAVAILPTTPGAQRIATRFLYSMEGSPLRDLYAGRPRCIEARSISSRRPR